MPGQRRAPAPTAEEAQARIDDQYVSYRADADDKKQADEKYKADGRLHGPLFDQLEPLLFMPTPPAYIDHKPRAEGHPFPTTGLKSVQVQIDRMNDVLGKRHWRVLLHYTQSGTLCKAVILVGNDLHYARLHDVSGELIPVTYIDDVAEDGTVRPRALLPDIIAMHEGWGGWKSRTVGDTFKAAETNALKRALARFGPGADVYRVDYEEDILTALKGAEPTPTAYSAQQQGNAAAAPARPRQQAAAPAQAAPAQQAPPPPPQEYSDEEAKARLDAILSDSSVDPDMMALRLAVDSAMRNLPEASRPTVQQRLALIEPRKDDAQQLEDLRARATNAAAGS